MKNSYVKYLFVFSTSLAIFCLDQATKILTQTQIKLNTIIPVIEGYFNLTHVTNQGGAFGLFGDNEQWIRILLFIFFPIICVLLIFWMIRGSSSRTGVLGYSFILGGAFGNLFDRVRLGYVVDFLDFYYQDYHWPSFNVADSFVVLGVGVCFLSFYLEGREAKKDFS